MDRIFQLSPEEKAENEKYWAMKSSGAGSAEPGEESGGGESSGGDEGGEEEPTGGDEGGGFEF